MDTMRKQPAGNIYIHYTRRFKKIYLCLIAVFCMGFISTDICLGQQTSVPFLDLDEACLMALQTHEQIMIAEREIVKSQLLPKKADSIVMPKASAYAAYRRLDNPIEWDVKLGEIMLPPITTIPEEQVVGDVEITQPLYRANWQPRRQQATHIINRNTEAYYQVVQDILFTVTQAYYEVNKAKELVKNSQELLQLAENEHVLATVKFEQGVVTEDAVLSSELKMVSTQSKLIENTNYLQWSRNLLTQLIGGGIGDYDVMPPKVVSASTEEFRVLVDMAMDNRHDYKQSLALIDIASSDVEAGKARFYPTVDASLGYYMVDRTTYYEDYNHLMATIQLKIPLFEGGIRWWDLKEKRESLQQAKLTKLDLKKRIETEVDKAMLSVQTYEGVLQNSKKQVELAQKNYAITFSKFKSGAATNVDLNQAFSILNTSKKELIVTTYDHQVAILRLRKVLGIFARDFIKLIDIEALEEQQAGTSTRKTIINIAPVVYSEANDIDG